MHTICFNYHQLQDWNSWHFSTHICGLNQHHNTIIHLICKLVLWIHEYWIEYAHWHQNENRCEQRKTCTVHHTIELITLRSILLFCVLPFLLGWNFLLTFNDQPKKHANYIIWLRQLPQTWWRNGVLTELNCFALAKPEYIAGLCVFCMCVMQQPKIYVRNNLLWCSWEIILFDTSVYVILLCLYSSIIDVSILCFNHAKFLSNINAPANASSSVTVAGIWIQIVGSEAKGSNWLLF